MSPDKIVIDDNEGPESVVETPKPGLVRKEEAAAPRQAPKKAVKEADPEPDGTDFVELEDEKVKARFKRLYRHQKEATERADRTERAMHLLAEQNQKLYQTVEKLIADSTSKKTQEELKTLRQEAKEAIASGDADAFTEVNERLVEIKAEEKARQAREQTREQTRQPPAAGGVSQEDLAVLRRWQSAEGEDGEPLRPWAQRDHEDFATTQEIMRKVSASERFKDATAREILAEVDRRMKAIYNDSDGDSGDNEDEDDGNAVRRAFSAPRTAGNPKTRDRAGLSAREKVIAEAMFLSGRNSVAKNAAEAHAIYQRQRAAIGRVVVEED